MSVKIIKLGGSVIAPKEEPLSADIPSIQRLAEELGKFLAEEPASRVVVVHGGGSFGHYLVKECVENKGYLTPSCSSRVAFFMDELNRMVLEALLSNRIPAVRVPGRTLCYFRGDGIECFFRQLKNLISRGLVPVTYGDVTSSSTGFSVISGDVLAWMAVKELKAKEVVFLSDVNGLYTSDPHTDPAAKLIKEAKATDVLNIISGGSSFRSVTGDLTDKIRWGIKLGVKGVKMIVASGLRNGNLYNSLRGLDTGTVLWF